MALLRASQPWLHTGVSTASRSVEEALDRLNRVLPTHAPALWSSRRAPVDAKDLDALRRAVDPYAVPHDLVALLRWSDGQAHQSGPQLRPGHQSPP